VDTIINDAFASLVELFNENLVVIDCNVLVLVLIVINLYISLCILCNVSVNEWCPSNNWLLLCVP
jgi:hypothetical protein